MRLLKTAVMRQRLLITTAPSDLCICPLGWKAPLDTFQRAMDVLLMKFKLQFDLVYLDDIIILLRAADEYIDHVRQLLTLLPDAGLTLKLKKCQFLANRNNYLGQGIRHRDLELSTRQIDANCGLRKPTTVS